MIPSLLLGLLFIAVLSALLLFLLYLLYPSLEQQNFPMEDSLAMPWPTGWTDSNRKALFRPNSPADCQVVRGIYSGKEGRQNLCANFEKCVDTCPRLNSGESLPEGTPACTHIREGGAEGTERYRNFLQKLDSIANKFRGPR